VVLVLSQKPFFACREEAVHGLPEGTDVAVSAEVLVTGGDGESYFEAVIKMCQDGRGK
jgi:hypothetical protein